MLKGYYTALITPFKENKIDDQAFQHLVEDQINAGVSGLVPCGTTGESPTLSKDEQCHVLDLCVEAAKGQLPIYAGTGSNNTVHAIEASRYAEKIGVDGCLSIVPYYNKPTQEGLYQHFKAIHDAINIPIILYNHPGRTGTALTVETIARLAELPRIIGIKDGSGDLTLPKKITAVTGSDFVQLTGNDDNTADYLGQGGRGAISVASNIAPKQCMSLFHAFESGDKAEFEKQKAFIADLSDALFCETNPGPIKHALSLKGYCTNEMRLPLVPPSEESQKYIADILEKLGLL